MFAGMCLLFVTRFKFSIPCQSLHNIGRKFVSQSNQIKLNLLLYCRFHFILYLPEFFLFRRRWLLLRTLYSSMSNNYLLWSDKHRRSLGGAKYFILFNSLLETEPTEWCAIVIAIRNQWIFSSASQCQNSKVEKATRFSSIEFDW